MSKTIHPNLSITNTLKSKLPGLPFLKMKDVVLGKNYELSVVFASDAETRKLNCIYRGKNKPANVLAFPLSKNRGEVFLCPAEIKKYSGDFGRRGDKLTGFFLIHALVHLKGHRHGSTMEKTEARFRRAFGI